MTSEIFIKSSHTARRHSDGVEVLHHMYLTWVWDGGKWSASNPSHFTPMEKPRTPIE